MDTQHHHRTVGESGRLGVGAIFPHLHRASSVPAFLPLLFPQGTLARKGMGGTFLAHKRTGRGRNFRSASGNKGEGRGFRSKGLQSQDGEGERRKETERDKGGGCNRGTSLFILHPSAAVWRCVRISGCCVLLWPSCDSSPHPILRQVVLALPLSVGGKHPTERGGERKGTPAKSTALKAAATASVSLSHAR